MARTVRDEKLETRSARLKHAMRREPYWRSISPGIAIGYRRLSDGGTWIARHYGPETGRRYQALGTADDVADADGRHVLSFAQAQNMARAWFQKLAREDRGEGHAGPFTVGQALDEYLADYERRGGRAKRRAELVIDAHIRPEFGKLSIGSITRARIEKWHACLAAAPPRLRSKRGDKVRHAELDGSEDAIRRRRSTANRVLTILKAALNLARRNGRADNADAWQLAKPFRSVDAPKIRYLSDDETRRLVNSCAADFRSLVTAGLLTGARYGELARMKVGDFNPDTNTLFIGRSKSGRPRHIHLTDEGARHFTNLAAGKSASDLLLTRAGGGTWNHAHQTRPIREACDAAKIKPAIGFHILRHTYASRLAMRGVQLPVIAAQLGHADTRMTERHYAHLAPSYVGDTVRAAFGSLDIVPETNLTSLQSPRRRKA